MILIPLAVTAQLLHANVWEYMAFGAAWSAWLCLIHSEVHHPWDGLFRLLGLGTAGDHHVHHRTFIFNVRNLAQPGRAFTECDCPSYPKELTRRSTARRGLVPRRALGGP